MADLAMPGSGNSAAASGSATPNNGQTTGINTGKSTGPAMSIAVPTGGAAVNGQNNKKKTNKTHTENHEALSDAVAASGVNIRAEEEAMVGGLSISKRQIEQNTFLKPAQLQWFMRKTLDEQGIKPVMLDGEVTSTISSSCEQYMAQILADAIVMMRHRRHLSDSQVTASASAASASKSGSSKGKISKSSKGSKSSLSTLSGINSKSEISKALRDLAAKHKEKEEKRVRRRVMLGLEEEKPEEDLIQDHKQTNLTASMMMSGSKQKKYSWMQSSSSSANSNSFNSRGDNGIRYREAREEPSVVMRDLIAALENRRMGVSNTLLKAYARLKD